MQLSEILGALRPGAAWVLRGETLADLEWLSDQPAPTQEEVDAYVPPPPKVTTVSPRQARLALFAAGILPDVEAAVKAAGGAVQISWEFATEINRDDPLISSIRSSLGLTPEQIDLIFQQAATL